MRLRELSQSESLRNGDFLSFEGDSILVSKRPVWSDVCRECFDGVRPSLCYGLHQDVQHGVSLGGSVQLVLLLGCEADEVVLTDVNLVLGEVQAIHTEVEVNGCLGFLAGSGRIPSLEYILPKKDISSLPMSQFSEMKTSPRCLALSEVVIMLLHILAVQAHVVCDARNAWKVFQYFIHPCLEDVL